MAELLEDLRLVDDSSDVGVLTCGIVIDNLNRVILAIFLVLSKLDPRVMLLLLGIEAFSQGLEQNVIIDI